jgi:hypothetical protein
MKVWTNNTFVGHWPVGTSAVVVAPDAETAARLLGAALAEEGLEQTINPATMIELPLDTVFVRVLQTGDY